MKTLYSPSFEHDACGVGLVANLSGEPTHAIVEAGLTVLRRLMHRGATGNDPETGDGAGLLFRIPDAFFRRVLPSLPPAYGVAMIFGGEGAEPAVESAAASEGCRVVAWRDVPTDPSAIGRDARSVMPRIRQLFLAPAAPAAAEDPAAFERRLLLVRRAVERAAPSAYVCSCSSRTVVYKGLLLATQIERFYPDLDAPDFASPFAIVHQRYSTNTFPSWPLAHPFRALAHNGEINTLKGNLAALSAREPSLASPLFGADIAKLLPVVAPGQSDSASLDNLFELLVAAGRDAPHAMMMLVPQAWGAKYHVGHDVRAFCEYHSALMEPWDGPAAVAFTDGLSVGAALDRNGLRPARWTLTRGGLFVLASETGVLDIPAADVARHGRLRPGSILWLDLAAHRLREDAELKAYYARRRPYRRWVAENHIPVNGLFTEVVPSGVPSTLPADQARFGWTLEDLELVLRPMAETGHEPVGAMGNDAALACLSPRPRTLFDYFHQLFAQVTNPPIDPIREELVMSIMTFIGNLPNILDESPAHARLVKLTRPVLTDDELRRLANIPEFPARTLSLHFGGSLRDALSALSASALSAVAGGAKILVLSDRAPAPSAPLRIPSLLAVAAVNKALSAAGVRPSVGLIVESGEVLEVHHYAVLLGFGATAVNPWLALASVSALSPADPVAAAANYVTAVCKGVMKVMSKMGISTLRSYRTARIFEAIGLGPRLMADYFPDVVSPVAGLEIEDLESALCRPAGAPSLPPSSPAPGGAYRLRRDGPAHLWTPDRLVDFRESVRQNDYPRFRRYTASVDSAAVTLRSRLSFASPAESPSDGTPAPNDPTIQRPNDPTAQRSNGQTVKRSNGPIPLEEVEPVESVLPRFLGGAMSLGSLSPEAHETIALALNTLGCMSNSGEGGENPERFGTNKNSAVKQVASGRFGVTVEYLRSARDLQIKIAQGAKPGEGGQLPAHKVDAFIGRLRHAAPGTPLISPPPHHDIYSIEDLAQLVYDLRCVNPSARISVKLVSAAGVGTVAAGVAKAHADVVVVSGFDGGTGAAPLTSMKHAGIPWEPGLAEAHQTLVKNDLRSRVRLQVDGQLRTGRDIVVAAILGADEFAFGTSMLVSLGCVQCRHCNLNACPVGIATQRPELRARFAGKPEHLQTYFRFLAQEVRETLASLGLRSLAEARGRTDLLSPAALPFDFSNLLAPESPEGRLSTGPGGAGPASPSPEEVPPPYDALRLIPALAPDAPATLDLPIANSDRSVGAALSGHVAAARAKDPGAYPAVSVTFTGTAGQSFGAFLARGIDFTLRGAANDYVAKGLSGGTISIAPPPGFAPPPEKNAIVGNVLAYGATSGAVYVNGLAGERFGIRNSGATLVVEGVGDHGCEYMTGGTALVLGPVGVNFAAGMTGGVAYVLDGTATLDLHCNLDSVDLFPVLPGSPDEAAILDLLRAHLAHTSSPLAARLLDAWPTPLPLFVKVLPTRP